MALVYGSETVRNRSPQGPPSSGLGWEEMRTEVQPLRRCPLALRVPYRAVAVFAGAADSAAVSAAAADYAAVETVMAPPVPGVLLLFFFVAFSLRFRFETYKQFNFVGRRPELSQW
jgi:hypothetical protein